MQDFFCPRCGRRMLDGHCAHCENRTGHAAGRENGTRVKKAQGAAAGNRPGPALTEEKVIPFDSIKRPVQQAPAKKEEIEITLVDSKKLAEEKKRELLEKQPWRAPGLSPLKRAALRISHGVSRFTAFVDGLVNPEDE